MYIQETFATRIEKRIEPVVIVTDQKPATVLNELNSLVITPQWEKYLRRILEEFTDAYEREDEREIGVWISGFFGSGKSLLMKVLGILLRGGEVDGQDIHGLFLNRLPAVSQERRDIERFLAICRKRINTSLIGGNLHANMASGEDPLTRIAFKFFAEERGYTRNWTFAWEIEYQIDQLGRTEAFRQRVCELSGKRWERIVRDSGIYGEKLRQAAAEILPEYFSGPEAVREAVNQAFHNGIEPRKLIERLCDWCASQDRDGRRYKVLLQLDELGQWLQSGTNATRRAMEVQALVETASSEGQGRIWVAVTAHGDVQALKENMAQETYSKINQRFDLQCKLSNEDIDRVVRTRLLRKKQHAGSFLRTRFQERQGEIIDLGSLQRTRQIYRVPTAENFVDFYPYLPWIIDVIPKIVKGIAQAANRSEALTGSNRTMIGVIQGGIIEPGDFLTHQVGDLLSLADLYDQLSSDTPVETRTDLQRIVHTVEDATSYTTRVARALYLLGQDELIPCTVHNVTLAIINSLNIDLNSERAKVKIELERLVNAGYAKQVGDTYVFLSTQQRSFQDKVRRRQYELYERNYDLGRKLKDFESEDALRFDHVPVLRQSGREKLLKIELDGRTIHNASEQVVVRVSSPVQYYLDQDLKDEAAMRLRSSQEPHVLFFRMGESKELRDALARWAATREVADEVLSSGVGNEHEKQIADQVTKKDLPLLRSDVIHELAQAVRAGRVFLGGNGFDLMSGENPQEMVRNTLSNLLFTRIYTRFQEMPHRLVNEVTAVKAALNDNTTSADLQALKVYNADGTLNVNCALLSTLKGFLPASDGDRGSIGADELRQRIEQPPYGWDGNTVKVGLALLLRVSQCHLIENSVPLNNPHSPQVVEVLTKATRFKALRVQSVRSELTGQELQAIRGHLQTIFDLSKLTLAPAALNTVLGEQMVTLQDQAQALKTWADVAQCPLPTDFGAGYDTIAELLNTTNHNVRLPHFLREWEAIARYRQLLHSLASFKNEQGTQFQQVQQFFLRMTNAEAVPSAVTAFLRDWRVLRAEQTITDAQHWSDLLASYHAATQALGEQMTGWVCEAREGIAELTTSLSAQLTAVGVPAERLAEEEAALIMKVGIQDFQAAVAQSAINYGDARRLRGDLARLRMNLPTHMREVAARYQPEPQANVLQVEPFEVHMNWQNVVGEDRGTLRIASSTDLEQAIERLRKYITRELAEGRIVILE